MLQRILSVGVFAAALVTACDQPAPPPNPPISSSPPRIVNGLARGMKVVAGTADFNFRGGTITAVGDKITVEYGKPDRRTEKKKTLSVDPTAAWRIGNTNKATRGQPLVCRLYTGAWYACKVTKVSGGSLSVADNFGKEHDVKLVDVVTPNDEWSKRIGEYLATETKRRTFDKAFMAAGSPYRPSGWTPKKGDKLVIHFTGPKWYGGAVLEHKKAKKKVRISWEGDWDPRNVSEDEIAPQPSDPLEVKTGQFVIERPDKARHWRPAKVTGVDGDKVELLGRDGKARSAQRRDLIPIVH